MSHRHCLLLLVMCFALFSGCGGNGDVELSGKVTLDGAPVERGTIRFTAEDGTGPAYESTINPDGTYKVRVTPGAKKVSILGYKKIGEHHVQGPDSPLVDDLQQIVPPKYNEQTTLVEQVDSAKPTVNFDLTTQ